MRALRRCRGRAALRARQGVLGIRVAPPYNDLAFAPRRGGPYPKTRLDRELLLDLVAVLEAAPRGLRRWAVMRALRDRRIRAGREIALKFEDDVERLFRQFCVMDGAAQAAGEGGDGDATKPFFRPKETAGEVWAVDRERLGAFLASAGAN